MTDVSKHDPFWLVWCPTTPGSPRHRHESESSAVVEAERLARKYPNYTFVVVQSVCARRFGAMECIDLRPEVDDVPF